MVAERRTLEQQMAEMWDLVHELDDMSSQLHRAADAAISALGLPKKLDDTPGHPHVDQQEPSPGSPRTGTREP